MFGIKHLIIYVWPFDHEPFISCYYSTLFLLVPFPFPKILNSTLNSFNVSPKIKTPWNLTEPGHGAVTWIHQEMWRRSDSRVEHTKKAAPKIWESARGLDFRGAVRPLWSWEVGIWVVRWWFLLGGKGGMIYPMKGFMQEVILLMRIKKKRSVKEITLGDKLWLRLWSECEGELVMIDDGVNQ